MMPCVFGVTYLDSVLIMSVKIFLLVWIIAVPIVMTARLDKIVKLLQDKK